MPKALPLIVCLALAGLLAWAASLTPAPEAPGRGGFSATAAMADVRAIAVRAHPIGSAEHDRVRDYLVGRLRGIGLQTQVWASEAFEARRFVGGLAVEGGRVEDLIGVLPGRDRTAPALLIMAHYDTVPASPGAADDTTGVAAALQVMGRLKAEGTPARDVVLLLSDGEEAGMLGARAFFRDHPLARRIGAVLNLEAAGGAGRVYMFETGPGDGGMVRLFARTAVNPTANSVSGWLYSIMSNDTDFSIAKRRGLEGFNYAFLGSPFDYHSASSTAANLDQGSLQHMGAQVLAAARALAQVRALPVRAPDLVYGDLMGGPVIAYPAWGGWVLLALTAAIGLLACAGPVRREGFGARAFACGAGAPVLAASGFAILGFAARAAAGGGPALLAQFGVYEAALAAAGLAAAVLAVSALSATRPRFWSGFAGALFVLWLLTLALQAAAPLTAQMLGWPLLAAVVGAALLSSAGERWAETLPGLLWALFAAAAMALLLYWAHAIVLAVGAELPSALAVLMLPAVALLLPLAWRSCRDPSVPILGAACLAIAVGLTVYVRLHPPWSARHPRPAEAIYVLDGRGRAWRASRLGVPGPWTAAALTADGGRIQRTPLPTLSDRALAAPAAPVAERPPVLTATRLPDGRVRIALQPSAVHSQLRLELKGAGWQAGEIDGLKLPLDGQTRLSLAWTSPQGFRLTLTPSAAGPAEAAWSEIVEGWPAQAKALPPMPADVMPWGRSGDTAVIGAMRIA